MIDTVLFDMGGTLEDIVSTPKNLTLAAQGISRILSDHGIEVRPTQEEMKKLLEDGHRRYSLAREKNGIELKPERIWAEYMLADAGIDREKIEELSEELAYAWENLFFDRSLRPGVPKMLGGLRALGLKLGMISNTASLYQVFDQLNRYGIREYFSDVTLSSQIGYRKPHRGIFRIALLQMRSHEKNSVYVGDTVSRDVLGAQQAGFAKTILIHSQLTKEKDEPLMDAPRPDYVVEDILEIISICEDLLKQEAVKPAVQ